MDYSILISTYNRAEGLRHTLTSLFSIAIPAGLRFEVLVVDNNSSDHTREVAESFEFTISEIPLRYMFEQRQGACYARNTGISEAKGDILIFTDDDVEFSHNWLIDLHQGFLDHPEAICVTGQIQPKFPKDSDTSWIPENRLVIYGRQNYGNQTKLIEYPDNPIEMNMAIRKEAFLQAGMFSTQLGRVGYNLLSNDGKVLFFNIHKIIPDKPVIYIPGALIYHLIPPQRNKPEWLLDRWYWQGISDARFDILIDKINWKTRLSRGLDALFKLIKLLTGGNLAPRKLYWHYKSLKLSQRVLQAELTGQVREYFFSLAARQESSSPQKR